MLFDLVRSSCGRYVHEMQALLAFGEHSCALKTAILAASDCGVSIGPRPNLAFPLVKLRIRLFSGPTGNEIAVRGDLTS